MACFVSPINYNNTSDEIKIKELKRLDFTNDSIMSKILDEVTDKVRNGDRCAYYSVSVNEYGDGYLMRIEKSYKDVFESRRYPFAYTEFNDRLIVFNNLGNYPGHYSSIPQKVKIKTARLDEQTEENTIIYYYILDDVYARFSPEAGWIWSDGKPDE